MPMPRPECRRVLSVRCVRPAQAADMTKASVTVVGADARMRGKA
jgi:hypothetical protein